MITHGKTKTPIYRTWERIKYRCSSENHKQYADYGGRGITVCDRWLNSFENFYVDMGDRPEGMTLDRIDNDKGYSPENCQWASRRQQQLNRRPKSNTGISGISWSDKHSKFVVQNSVGDKKHFIGRFDTLNKAVVALIEFRTELAVTEARIDELDILPNFIGRESFARIKTQILDRIAQLEENK